MSLSSARLAGILATLASCGAAAEVTLDEAAAAPAMAADNECEGNDEDCAFKAFQLRGMKKRNLASTSVDLGASAGQFLSSKDSKTFAWTPGTRSVEEAIAGPGWSNAHFADGSGTIDQAGLANWIKTDLFAKEAFGASGHDVPVPWPASGGDQVGDGQWVAYSRRQVCYIVAKAMTGSGTAGYNNGLTRFMNGCPKTGGFGKSMVTLLSSCAADPTLADGGAGPMIVVARGKYPPAVSQARSAAASTPLAAAGLRVCQYNDGVASLGGVPKVPGSGCAAPSSSAVGRDFMTGGLGGQATQDISASFLGGYVFGHACGLGGGQDERLMVYFPEVAAMTFFLSQDSQFPQLRQPAFILGARKFFTGLDGPARFNAPLRVDTNVPLKSDLATVQLKGGSYSMSSSRPFIAFMSENQGYFGGEDHAKLNLARRNKHPLQRLAGSEKYAFEKQVRAWYGSMALTSYHPDTHSALKTVVHSVGTGPWLAGLWWGDSQLGMLSVYIGQALAAPTWGGLPVDYYIYSDFTENPGNQCFVHSKANCAACLGKCAGNPLPGSAFWMPGYALMSGGSCAASASDCGSNGIEQVLAAYSGKTAAELWTDTENAMRGKGTENTVFDLLLG